MHGQTELWFTVLLFSSSCIWSRFLSFFMRFLSNARRRTFVIGTSKINIGGLAIPPSPAFLPAVNLEIQLRGKSENMLERNVSHSRNELRDLLRRDGKKMFGDSGWQVSPHSDSVNTNRKCSNKLSLPSIPSFDLWVASLCCRNCPYSPKHRPYTGTTEWQRIDRKKQWASHSLIPKTFPLEFVLSWMAEEIKDCSLPEIPNATINHLALSYGFLVFYPPCLRKEEMPTEDHASSHCIILLVSQILSK